MVLANISSRISYTTNFKLKVVMFAKANGNRAAGCEFTVDKQCIRRWRGQEGVVKKTPNKKRLLRHGLAKFPELEVELIGLKRNGKKELQFRRH